MSGLVDSATAVMRASSARIDRAAVNVANVSTPGFKRQLQSSDRVDGDFAATLSRLRVDMQAGKLIETGAKLVQVYDDLMGKAISTFGQLGR
jgi:flagellar basal-body rod protein FlgF